MEENKAKEEKKGTELGKRDGEEKENRRTGGPRNKEGKEDRPRYSTSCYSTSWFA